MALRPTRAMPCRSISRRWTGSGRASITAVSLRPSLPRAKSISPVTVDRDLLQRAKRRSSAEVVGRRSELRRLPRRLSRALSNVSRTGHDSPRPRLRHFGRFMRFTSLVVELIRARPRLVVWIVVLLQAALWLIAAAAALSQPARRSRHRAGVRPGISGRHRSRPAAGVLARRHRLSRRRQPRVRRLSAGAALLRSRRSGRCISWRAPSSAASRRCLRCC